MEDTISKGGSARDIPVSLNNAPPYQGASQISLAMSLAEITVTLGNTRQIVDPSTGHPGIMAAIEWFLSVGLPAATARNLRDALNLAIEEYERRYGKIPTDPNIKFVAGASSTP